MTLGIPEVIVYANSVTVCGVTINRPASISPSQWLDFWNHANGKDNEE